MPLTAPSVDDSVATVADGTLLVLPREPAGPALAAIRALVRHGARDLRLVGVPTLGLQADLLIGAGCVAAVEAAAVSLGEHGPAPRFTDAVRAGTLRMRDSTCPALHAALQASEKGVPFMSLRGLIGSDILAHRPDWKVIDSPFGDDDPIVLLPAIRPDVALFHAPMADRDGNVWIGRQRELATMAHAAARTIVTVERIHDGSLLDDPLLAAGTLGGFYVDTIAVAEHGAWPMGLPDHYGPDDAHLAEYVRLAASSDGFAGYLDRYVHDRRAA